MKQPAQTFKVLADPVRLQLLQLLTKAGKPLCVCELVDSLNLPQYAVSRHLKELDRTGLIQSTKEGRWVYYSIAAKLEGFKKSLLNILNQIITDDGSEIQNRLEKRLKMRIQGKCALGIQNKQLISGEKNK